MDKCEPPPGKACDPKEIALKTFFLGPQAENYPWLKELFEDILENWVDWRRSRFPDDGRAISPKDQQSALFVKQRENFQAVARDLCLRFENEVPKFSPRYVGHMLSEVSLPALIGHFVALLHNPNNISGESSRVGTRIEEEAIDSLLSMIGFDPGTGAGHFTSGGTVANFEALIRAHSRFALWLSLEAAVAAEKIAPRFEPFFAAHRGWKNFDETLSQARQAGLTPALLAAWNLEKHSPFELAGRFKELGQREFPGPVILVPDNKHYSWKKGCRLLGLGTESLWPIPLDSKGRISITHLRSLIERAMKSRRPVLMVVSVVGTTELGGVDPVHEVKAMLDAFREAHGTHIWHHVDGAFGGMFRTVDLKESKALEKETLRALTAIAGADSITLDPHKLGYVPYASGAFLARTKRDYYFATLDDAPYIDFDRNLDRGPYTIEGSRSATGAVATWMTAKSIGLHPQGLGLLLERMVRISRDLTQRLATAGLPIRIAPGCDTNLVCFSCAKEGERLSVSNRRTLRIYDRFSPKKDGAFTVSKTSLRWESYREYLDQWTSSWSAERDANEVSLIRMCLMNPFFGSAETDVHYLELFVEELGSALLASE